MDKMKQYVAFTVLGCLAVLAAGWFLVVSPKRADAAALRTQADTQTAANAQLDNQLAILKAQAKDLPREQAQLASVAAKIPDNPALPALIRALTSASTAAGVELVTLTPGPPTAVVAVPAAAGTVAPPTRTPAGGSTAGGAATGAATAGQLAQIPVTLNVVGGYFQLEQFVSALENLPRSLRVSNITVAPGSNPVSPVKGTAPVDDGRSLTSTISAQVFLAANRAAPTPVVVPGQPVPAVPASPAKK